LTGDIYYFAFYRQRLALLAWGLSVHGWPVDDPELAGALGTAACAFVDGGKGRGSSGRRRSRRVLGSPALAARNDRIPEALESLPAVLDEWLRLGNTGLVGWTLQQIVVLLADLGRNHDAALLAGAMRADRVPTPAFAADTERVCDVLERLGGRLGPEQTATALDEGATMSPAAVLAHARNALCAVTR
jgi:hypothetical protein